MRRLYLTKAGIWYIALTIGLGVVALATANNVLTLMECMLLGGMILSGVVSEKAISSIEVSLARRQAIAGRESADELTLVNRSRLPFFCVEILEWREDGEGSRPLVFVPKLGAGETRTVRARRVFERRGAYEWQALGVATSAPFGFARKLRLTGGGGRRIVWPASESGDSSLDATGARRPRSGVSDASDEVRLFVPGDDARSIVWTLSAKGFDPVVRQRREERPELLLKLDLSCAADEEFERRVRRLAGTIYREVETGGNDGEVRLRLTSCAGSRTVAGRKTVLDTLAEARAEGPSS